MVKSLFLSCNICVYDVYIVCNYLIHLIDCRLIATSKLAKLVPDPVNVVVLALVVVAGHIIYSCGQYMFI